MTEDHVANRRMGTSNDSETNSVAEKLNQLAESLSDDVLRSLEEASCIPASRLAQWAAQGHFFLLDPRRDGDASLPWQQFVTGIGSIGKVHASSALYIFWQNVVIPLLPDPIADGVGKGTCIIALAFQDADIDGGSLTIEDGAERVRAIVTGRVPNVLFARMATHVLVASRSSNASFESRTRHFLVEVNGRGMPHPFGTSDGLKACGIGHFVMEKTPALELTPPSGALPLGLPPESYLTLMKGLACVIDIQNGLAAVSYMVADTQRKSSLGKPLFKWQAVQFKLTDGEMKLRMLQDMAGYLAYEIGRGVPLTHCGLDLPDYAMLLRTMYRLEGAQIQEDCLELGSGRAFLQHHPAWRRYMDYLTLRLLFDDEARTMSELGRRLIEIPAGAGPGNLSRGA